jgi:CheY-like chemotaxis protein
MSPSPVPFRAAVSPNNASRRILSVDDESDILYSRQAILELAGYEVWSAANGRQALERFEAGGVDLVLVDYRMPGMDGAAVAREIKKRKPQVPVVMVSGVPVDDEVLATIDCFLQKGQGPVPMLKSIARLLAA